MLPTADLCCRKILGYRQLPSLVVKVPVVDINSCGETASNLKHFQASAQKKYVRDEYPCFFQGFPRDISRCENSAGFHGIRDNSVIPWNYANNPVPVQTDPV